MKQFRITTGDADYMNTGGTTYLIHSYHERRDLAERNADKRAKALPGETFYVEEQDRRIVNRPVWVRISANNSALPKTALLRVTEWAERHLLAESDVRFVRTVDTGGYNLAVEVTTHDARRYLVAFSRKNTGEGIDDAWTCDTEPNGDDAWTTAPSAVSAFRGERAADVAFDAGGPLAR